MEDAFVAEFKSALDMLVFDLYGCETNAFDYMGRYSAQAVWWVIMHMDCGVNCGRNFMDENTE